MIDPADIRAQITAEVREGMLRDAFYLALVSVSAAFLAWIMRAYW